MVERISVMPGFPSVAATLCTIATAVVGMFMPVITGPDLAQASVNILWGSIYGLGFLLVTALFDLQPGFTGFLATIIGMIIWPLIVAITTFRLLRYLFISQKKWIIVVALALIILSLIFNVAISSVRGTFVEWLPIYSAFMDI